MTTESPVRLRRATVIGLLTMAALWLIAIVTILTPAPSGVSATIIVALVVLGLTVAVLAALLLARGGHTRDAILSLIASVLLNPLLYLAIVSIVAGPSFFDLPDQQ